MRITSVVFLLSGCGMDSELHEEQCFPNVHNEPHGELATSQVPIDYEGGSSRVSLVHKRDVDPIENGCVVEALVELSSPTGDCALTMRFGTEPGERALVLAEASLLLDSSCPGWLDPVEGSYEHVGIGRGLLDVPPVPELGEAYACYETTLAPTGTVRLRDADTFRWIDVELDGLVIEGGVASTGEPDVTCPGTE